MIDKLWHGCWDQTPYRFLSAYEGPLSSSHTGFEILEFDGSESVIECTSIARREFQLPQSDLVLSNCVAGGVLVVNCESGSVLRVDFEGGLEEYLEVGIPAPEWNGFTDFLCWFLF